VKINEDKTTANTTVD